MPENIVIDIYADKTVKIHKIKEGGKCYDLWDHMVNCIQENKDCKKKISEWDKCIGNK